MDGWPCHAALAWGERGPFPSLSSLDQPADSSIHATIPTKITHIHITGPRGGAAEKARRAAGGPPRPQGKVRAVRNSWLGCVCLIFCVHKISPTHTLHSLASKITNTYQYIYIQLHVTCTTHPYPHPPPTTHHRQTTRLSHAGPTRSWRGWGSACRTRPFRTSGTSARRGCVIFVALAGTDSVSCRVGWGDRPPP